MLFDQKAFDDAVKRKIASESHLWQVAVGVASGGGPWALRMWRRGDVGWPELTDVLIGVVVGSALEIGRRISARRVASYAVYKEDLERAHEREVALRQDLDAGKQENARLSQTADDANARLSGADRKAAIVMELATLVRNGELFPHLLEKRKCDDATWAEFLKWQGGVEAALNRIGPGYKERYRDMGNVNRSMMIVGVSSECNSRIHKAESRLRRLREFIKDNSV